MHPDLKPIFTRSGLWRLGWSYQQAVRQPLLLRVMQMAAAAHRKEAEQAGHAQPEQLRLL